MTRRRRKAGRMRGSCIWFKLYATASWFFRASSAPTRTGVDRSELIGLVGGRIKLGTSRIEVEGKLIEREGEGEEREKEKKEKRKKKKGTERKERNKKFGFSKPEYIPFSNFRNKISFLRKLTCVFRYSSN